MATHLSQGRLVIQDENSGIQQKRAVVGGRSKISKPGAKKGGVGLGIRKALNDITNKSSLPHETSSRIKNPTKEGFNVSGERFLHDHKKCIDMQRAAMEPCFLDTVLPGHDSVSPAELLEAEQSKTVLDCPHYYPEPAAELPMSEFSDWLRPLTRWDSPQSSPTCWDSPPSSPFTWEFEPVEFLLKQESDC